MPSSSSQPLVTIGIPVRNGARHLRDALDSALAQDYPHLEIAISDNASTDDTGGIARQYAERDPRIRYWRNPADLGIVGNFGRVLAEAHGQYFTWLACDDMLSSPNYVTRTVAYLEANPDVGICGCDYHILDLAGPGKLMPWRFPEIYPGRNPGEVRTLFFSWPQAPACFAIYGMGRREALARAPFDGRIYRGQFAVTHMEYPILLTVLKHGRIVALPEILRTYRCNPRSAYHREIDRLSGLDFVRLGLQTKRMLLRVALGFPLPPAEKVRLLANVLRNFLPRTFRSTRGEARRLRIAAEERRQLIIALRNEIGRRRDVLVRHALECAPSPGGPPNDIPDDLIAPSVTTLLPTRLRLPLWVGPIREAAEHLFTDFFWPPSAQRQAQRRNDIVDSLVLRQVCEDRLREIHRLTAEAEQYLARMQQAEHARVARGD